ILFSKSHSDNLRMCFVDTNIILGFSLWFYFFCPVAFNFTMNQKHNILICKNEELTNEKKKYIV
ncbi:hypothetical protein EFD62_08250, partial [Acetivibrio mesophilus]